MKNSLSDMVENTQSLSIEEENYSRPSDVEEEKEVCSSNVELPEGTKSFFYSMEKDNRLVQIMLNLKLAEQVEKVQRLKMLFDK